MSRADRNQSRSRESARGWVPRMRALGVRVEVGDDRVGLSSEPSHSLRVIGEGVRRGEERWMWILSVSHPRLDPAWVIEPEDALTRMRKLVAGQDVLTGDRAFDDAVHVVGDELALLAGLGHHTRRRLMDLLPQGRLAEGALRWTAPATGPRPSGLEGKLRDMMTVVRVLSADVDPLVRLRSHMVDDPEPGHRRRALERALAAGHTPTANERRALVRDRDHEVRLIAARAVHDAGALGRLAANATVEHRLRVQAVQALVALDDPAAVEALDRAASGGAPEAARLARALDRWLARDRGVLDRLGGAALAALLEHGPRAHHAEVMARLAEVGGEEAIPALAALAGAFFGPRALKDQARATIARITARLGGLRRGGLSVVGTPAGALAVSPEPGEDGDP